TTADDTTADDTTVDDSTADDSTTDDTADTETATAYVWTTSGSLNLRESAAAGAGILTTIPRLATVTVLDKGTLWCKVQYGSLTGYVQTAYLRFDAGETTANTAAIAWVYTVSGSLNLRVSAAGSAAVLTAIPRLAQVSVLTRSSTWCQIQYGAYVGYVRTQYLTDTKPAELSESDATEAETTGDSTDETTNTDTSTSADSTDDTTADESTGDTQNVPEDPTLAVPDTETYALITPLADATSLSLWTSCTDQSGWMMEIPQNSVAQVLRVGDTWCEVRYSNQTGFCTTEGLTLIEQ
ncbi:MAG: SH3 domain-containing protein, partial [Eubacteriales bacterium]|nr:SH3 domain-containing protein [Eubacteriales bacterium]